MSSYIFDFGANRGQNLKYFLSKADKVVAIEAIPELCTEISKNFRAEILNGNLTIINAFASNFGDGKTKFFVNKLNPELSTFQKHKAIHNHSEYFVQNVKASDLINSLVKNEDSIEYIKIDLEGADYMVLEDIFQHNITPKFISAEIHHENTAQIIINNDNYCSFYISQAGKTYGIFEPKLFKFFRKLFRIKKNSKEFLSTSSGPFGLDILGKWSDKKKIKRIVKLSGLGAKDLHGSKTIMRYRKTLPITIFVFYWQASLRKISIQVLKKLMNPDLYRQIRRKYLKYSEKLPSSKREKSIKSEFSNYSKK
jgi:FkbM family methyltransferase